MSAASVFFVTLTTQLGNGADTVLTFAALFADSLPGADYLIVFTIAVMADAYERLFEEGLSSLRRRRDRVG